MSMTRQKQTRLDMAQEALDVISQIEDGADKALALALLLSLVESEACLYWELCRKEQAHP